MSEHRLTELNGLSGRPDFWNDPGKAQILMRERNQLEAAFEQILSLEARLIDAEGYIELAEMEEDGSALKDAHNSLISLKEEAGRAELEALLSGEVDGNDCFVEIHPGAGGTEAQDWAAVLLRMYMRWANASGMKVKVLEEQAGDEAGIKSATILVKGVNAYGWLKTESGVHRLVRISPFDSSARRHTSFASVWVYPQIDDNVEIELNESDCRIDTYRASGAGGQHVNKTDSAVRITHEPSGIVVQCQNDRSQHKNRAQAWAMLRARLYELEHKKREESVQAAAESKTEIGWGQHIRSYVMQPYQLVKDLRTNIETSDVGKILDGELDEFLAASLAMKVGEQKKGT